MAWRNVLKNKTLSFLNILGLATGMAFALLIGSWVQYETSYDSFHKNKDNIALVMKHSLYNDQKGTQESTPLPLYYELRSNYPEVKRASRMTWQDPHTLKIDNDTFNAKGIYVDPDFLTMFSFPLLKGDVTSALKETNSIILKESTSKALFGDSDPIGKILKLDDAFDFRVTAVIKDPPLNSTIQFDYLAPYEFGLTVSEFIRNNKTNWGNNFMMNVVELNEGASMEAFSKKIGPLNVLRDNRIKNQTLFLHPLNKWHLRNDYKDWINTGGKIEYVRLFGIIGIFVLLIACINFMNLSTARSEKRAREVGIRKAIGSGRKQLIIQFLSESILTAAFSFLLSIAIIYLAIPFLRDVGFENINLNITSGSLLVGGLLICLFTGLVSGSYPAMYLSSFLPVKVLKGTIKQSNGAVLFRKVLVVSQFTISIGLIISTIIVYEQINFARSRSLGYNPDNLISVTANAELVKNYEPLKQDLLNTGNLEAVAKASQPMTRVYNRWSDFSWEGKAPNSDIALDALMTEWDFEKAAGLKFKQGRPFSKDYPTDSNGVILNETALKVIGYKDPIGKTMKTGDRVVTIVGIIEDIVIDNPFKPVYPLAILFNSQSANNIFLRVKPGADLKETLDKIQPVFQKYNASSQFEYSFVDEEYDQKFALEKQVGKLSGIFAGLAIFISCLGLFGLAAYIAEQRTKEIGIRKVLGASISQLWLMLSKDFILLVLISCVIASPLAYYFLQDWLQKYAYRIDIGMGVFLVAAVLAIFVTLITVSFQAIRAALMNPVRSLRSE